MMSDYTIRPWHAGDEPQLKELWQIAFGDPEETIDLFFSLFLKPGGCVIAEADGKVVSAMYVLPGEVTHFGRRKTLTAGYTYALATLPAYRGRGIGSAVYKAANALALEAADAACVLPAKKSLYPFYQNASGAQPVSYIREVRIPKSELAGVEPYRGMRSDALRYAWMRDSFLTGKPHVTLPDEFFEFMEGNGMEFLVLESGLAAAETVDGVCYIRELLDPTDDVMRSIACVAHWCPAEEYVVRTPLFSDGPGEVKPYMLAALKQPSPDPMPDDLWWGLGLE